MKGRSVSRLWPCIALALAGTFLLSACDFLGARNRPETMRVLADHEDLEGPVRMVTSRSFVQVLGPEGQGQTLQFLSADTVMVELPMDSTFRMAPTYSLAVRFLAPQEELDPVPKIMLRVWVDGSDTWNGTQSMFPGAHIEYFLRHSL